MFTREKEMVVCRMKDVRIVIVLLLVFPLATAAKVGEWKNYTNMQNVRGVASDGSSIWAATAGGVFRFDPADSTYQKFTNSEGLTTNDATAITVDPEGRVWIGQQSGTMDVYDPATGQWRYISDIQKHSSTIKKINAFYFNGDELYIATTFGITVFSRPRFEFIDTYANFSISSTTLLQPNVTSVIKFQNRIFATTSGGIVASKIGAINLAAPESWEVTSVLTTGNSLCVFNGELYTGARGGLYRYNNNAWSLVLGSADAIQIMSAADTALIIFENRDLKSVHASGSTYTLGVSAPDSAVGGAFAVNAMFFGFNSSGVGSLVSDSAPWRTFYPNGPASNTFVSLIFDGKGVLWAGSGRLTTKGFYSFNGTWWQNYSPAENSAIQFQDCYKIAIGNNDAKWVAGTGGIALLDEFGNVRKTYSATDPGFGNAIGFTDVLLFGIANDANGDMWVSNYNSANNTMLWRFSADSTWSRYSSTDGYNVLMDMIIDNEGTKWFTGAVPLFNPGLPSKQLVFYNEKDVVSDTENGWGKIGTEFGLTHNTVTSLIVDTQGDIWVGTAEGITIIRSPRSPRTGLTRVFIQGISELYINCIAVDALNNKWLGTSQGVIVLSPDGTQTLEQYNVENTNKKLVDNNILSIAFDRRKGIAYFGTEKGLSSLEIVSVAVKSSLSTIDLSPNPVYLPEHDAVEIRGLVEESTVKVLTINGKVLKQFPAQGGGRAFWDCKDGDGNSVASGIYIIVAHDKSGTQAASAKVAVIRK